MLMCYVDVLYVNILLIKYIICPQTEILIKFINDKKKLSTSHALGPEKQQRSDVQLSERPAACLGNNVGTIGDTPCNP